MTLGPQSYPENSLSSRQLLRIACNIVDRHFARSIRSVHSHVHNIPHYIPTTHTTGATPVNSDLSVTDGYFCSDQTRHCRRNRVAITHRYMCIYMCICHVNEWCRRKEEASKVKQTCTWIILPFLVIITPVILQWSCIPASGTLIHTLQVKLPASLTGSEYVSITPVVECTSFLSMNVLCGMYNLV